jgi:hypothetical protein
MIDRREFAVQSSESAVQDGDDGKRDTGGAQSISDSARLVGSKFLNHRDHAAVVHPERKAPVNLRGNPTAR